MEAPSEKNLSKIFAERRTLIVDGDDCLWLAKGKVIVLYQYYKLSNAFSNVIRYLHEFKKKFAKF